MLLKWNEGWNCFLDALEGITPEDLGKTVFIRNEGQSVTDAIQRQVAHYSYHIGQIVFIGKLIRGSEWISLSIPKGQSDQYNATKFEQDRHDQYFTDSA